MANGMYSKDGEYVDMSKQCDLSGQVEVWLNRLLKEQQATVMHEMDQAVITYEEKPREQWIFDFPAQVWRGRGVREGAQPSLEGTASDCDAWDGPGCDHVRVALRGRNDNVADLKTRCWAKGLSVVDF